MKRSRFSEEQIIGILKIRSLEFRLLSFVAKNGTSDASFYKCKTRYDGLEVSEAKRLMLLEDENTRLKRLLADAMLDNAASAPRQHREQAEQQDFIERIGDLAGLPLIRHIFEIRKKNCRLGQSLAILGVPVNRNPPCSNQRISTNSALQTFVT